MSLSGGQPIVAQMMYATSRTGMAKATSDPTNHSTSSLHSHFHERNVSRISDDELI